MYTPPHFRAESPELIREIVADHPFSALITPSSEGLKITHLPVLYDADRGANGTVRAHMAKANPHWRAFQKEAESIVLVMGPHAYISSTWYEPDTGVSTWNYAAIHLYGAPSILSREDSISFLEDLVTAFEPDGAYNMDEGRKAMERQVDGIVAFEMEVTRIEAKFKMSQNKSASDRQKVIEMLSQGSLENLEVARLVKELSS